MSPQIADAITHLKQEFASNYSGNAHIQDILPTKSSANFSMNGIYLDTLAKFAESNPIYYNSFQQTVSGISCTVYEGDINEYWLGSIKHGSSCQPFYPTWLVSAFVLADTARNFGCAELVDIGSGDGRIAFCAAMLGMNAHSIEIDDSLVQLQQDISKKTRVNFNPTCADALEINYSEMKLTKPAFIVGGLPQMGGEMLAEGLMNQINNKGVSNDANNSTTSSSTTTNNKECDTLANSSLLILTGEGKQSGPAARHRISTIGGWDSLISHHNLHIVHSVNLPTVWTFDQDEDTPYIICNM